MHRIVFAVYFALSLTAAPASTSTPTSTPTAVQVFVDPLGAEPLVPIEVPAAGAQAESAATEPTVAEPAPAPATTELAPPPATEPALAPTTESASAAITGSAAGPAVAVGTEAASTALVDGPQLSETAPIVAGGAVAGSFGLGDLVVEPEGLRPSPLPDRPRWTDAVDEALDGGPTTASSLITRSGRGTAAAMSTATISLPGPRRGIPGSVTPTTRGGISTTTTCG